MLIFFLFFLYSALFNLGCFQGPYSNKFVLDLVLIKWEGEPFSVTMEIQSPQWPMSCQVVDSHHGDVVEGEINSQSLTRYHGNVSESVMGAVTGELRVAAAAGRPPLVLT